MNAMTGILNIMVNGVILALMSTMAQAALVRYLSTALYQET